MRYAVTIPDTVTGRCGTYGGYQRHKRDGEDACEPCREANNTYARDYRRRTGQTSSTLMPLDAVCPNCGHPILDGQP